MLSKELFDCDDLGNDFGNFVFKVKKWVYV